MSFKKKILLSLSIFFSFLIISVAGVAFNGNKTSSFNPAQEVGSSDEKVLLVTSEDKNPVRSSLDFTYLPQSSATASTSATTKVYEYAFGNTGTQQMGVDLYTRLSEMVGDGQDLNVNVSYATSGTRLTSFIDKAMPSYSIPKIESGNTQYVYVILSVIDKTQPVEFTTSLDWIYGKPVDITCYIQDESAGLDYQEQLTLIASTNIYESLTKINVRGGYGVEGYFSNAEKTDEIDSNTLVYDGIKVYFKLDTTGEFNPYNNPNWFALMGPDADGNGADDVQKYSGIKLAGVPYYYYKNFLQSKADVSPYYFQVIRGNTTITVSTSNSDYTSLGEAGQLLIPARYTLKGTSITVPVKKIESIEVYDAENDPNPQAVFSGQKQITSIIISEGIETIGYGCFNECDSIRYIELPSSITFVNKKAFQYCDNLEEVKFRPRTDDKEVVFARNTFIENPKLAKITLPNNLTTIPESGFYKNTNLRTIHIPASVTQIAAGAFNTCTSLTSVYFEQNSEIEHIIYDSFSHCISLLYTGTYVYDGTNDNAIKETKTNSGLDLTMLNGLQTIGRSAFDDTGIISVKLPRSLSSMSDNSVGTVYGRVFRNCKNLTEVEFEDGLQLQEIPSNTFENCSKLTAVKNLPYGMNIRQYAFKDCSSLKTITTSSVAEENIVNIPSTIVETFAFYNCTSITKVAFNNSITNINEYTFSGCERLVTVDFGNSAPETIGRIAFGHCDSLKNSIINGVSYGYFKVPEGVQYVGHGAFYDSLGLEEVELPSTLVEDFYDESEDLTYHGIDNYAFQACTNLKRVVLNGSSATGALQTLSSNVFQACTNLERVVIPNNIKDIGNSVFKGCTKLTKITSDSSESNGIIILPGNSDLVINQETFANCTGLTSINFGRIKTIGRMAFQGCTKLTSITIPNTVISISDYVFQDCSGLQTATLNTTFSTLPAATFMSCGNLTTVNLPSSITTIGASAFYNCYKLNQRNITANVTLIENRAFFNCYALEDIDLSKATIIENRAFTYSGLKSLTIPSTVTAIGEWAFAYCDALTTVDFSQCVGDVLKEANLFNSCKALTSVTINKNLTIIGNNIFQSCSNLRNVTFEEGSQITNISSNSFRATAITSIILPDSVTTLSNWAFADCTSLASIQMDNVNFIKHRVFSGCTALANTIINGEVQNGFITTEALVTIGYAAFHQCTSLKTLEIGTKVSGIQDYAFYGAGLTYAKFRLTGANWRLYASNQGTATSTSYGTITISSDGTKYKYGSSSEISLAVGLTSTTVSLPNQGGVYAVYLYWAR